MQLTKLSVKVYFFNKKLLDNVAKAHFLVSNTLK